MTPPLRTRTAVLATLAALSLAVACGGSTTLGTGDAGKGPVGDGAIPDPGTPGGRVPKEHRPSNDICGADQPTVVTGSGGGFGPCPQVHECTTDAECQDSGKQGKCGTVCGGQACFYDTCEADSDCKGGTVCGCANGPAKTHVCFAAGNCRVDADCGSHGYCSPSLSTTCSSNFNGTAGFFCHTASDECVDDADCNAMPGPSQSATCRYDMAATHWKCSTTVCAG